MRRLILNILLLAPSMSYGQKQTLPDTVTKIQVTATFWATPGKTYVDSMEMDMTKTYLDPDNIKEVKTFKGQDSRLFSGARGAIIITRKIHQPFVSLSDLKPKSPMLIDTALLAVYVINGIALSDTVGVSIEATAFKSLDILNTAEKPEFYHEGPRKTIYIITTKQPKANRRKKNGY